MIVAVVGNFGPETGERLRLAVLRGQSEPAMFDDVEQARAELGKPDQPAPRCIFLDGCAPGVESFVEWMRGQAKLFSVPAVVLVPALDDGAFAEVHAFGGDDVVLARDDDAVMRRIANLAGFDPTARARITQGRGVIAHPDEGRRRILGRILRQAGFDLSFAASTRELVEVTTQGDAPSLVVMTRDFDTDGGAIHAIAKARSALGSARLPFVVLGSARDLRALDGELDGLSAVVASSELAPADNLLFLANELMRPDVENLRASRRLLFGALCSFRPHGSLEPVYGLSYNISREGLYVRTLDAPPRGTEVWFELKPPHAERAVHLRGEVVWTRGLSQAVGGAAPPGFGIRLRNDACPPEDLRAYWRAYDQLLEQPRIGH